MLQLSLALSAAGDLTDKGSRDKACTFLWFHNCSGVGNSRMRVFLQWLAGEAFGAGSADCLAFSYPRMLDLVLTWMC